MQQVDELTMSKERILELAEEGRDPQIMLCATSILMSDKEKVNLSKAEEIITKAERIFGDNLDVKEMYARVMHIKGHIGVKIAAYDSAIEALRKCIATLEDLKVKNYHVDIISNMEIDACMELGEAAFSKNDYELSIKMFARTDVKKYPYASVLIAFILFEESYKYHLDIYDVIANINQDFVKKAEDFKKIFGFLYVLANFRSR